MIVEYIRYSVAPDRSAAFLDAYAKAETVLQQNPHCLAYEVAQSHEEMHHDDVRSSSPAPPQ